MTEIIKSRLIRVPHSTQTTNPYQQQQGYGGYAAGPVYPNRHSGRPFTNLLPNQQRIILPIRGEKVIKTTEMLAAEQQQKVADTQKDIRAQAEELNKLVGDIKKNKEMKQILDKSEQTRPIGLDIQRPSTQNQPAETQVQKEMSMESTATAEKQAEQKEVVQETPPPQVQKPEPKTEEGQLQMQSTAEVKQVEQKIEENKKQETTVKEKNIKPKEKKIGFFARLFGFGKKVRETSTPMTEIPEVEHKKPEEPKQVEQKQEAPTEKKPEEPKPTMPGLSPLDLAKNKISAITSGPKYANMQPLTNNPNCISGIVLDSAGKTQNGLVVVIKTSNGEPVRAVKTNQVGQFVITTPLTNGMYTVTVDPANNAEVSFENVEVKLEGKVLKPLEFKGK